MSKLSEFNSTKVLLSANDNFTGNIEDIEKYNYITINVFSDTDSSNNGLELYFSNRSDANFEKIIKYTYFSNINKEFTVQNNYKYFYVKYTNSSSDQSVFHLNCTYKMVNDTRHKVDLNPSNIDTFKRIRTSELSNLYETNQIYNKNTLKEDEYVFGTGSISYDVNTSMNTLSVSANNDRVIRQTRVYTHYQPGKSFLIFLTGIINNGTNDSTTTSRIGYFDDNNGLFFEYSNETMYVVMRSYETGSAVDTKVSQDNWNYDTLNGYGISRLNISFSDYLIYTINFSWLGAGIVEMGIYYAGTHYLLHRFRNINITVPYITTPHLPGRFEIVSSGGSGSMKEACISINSETSQELIGQIFSIGTTSGRTVNNTEDFIMGIKLSDNSRRNVILKTISLICTSKGNIEYKIYLVLSPSSTPITDAGVNNGFVSVNTNSVVEYNITGTAFDNSNAILLYQGYFSTLQNIGTRQLSNTNDPIYLTAGIGIDGFKSDYIVVTGRNISGTNNETINCTLNWIEI